MTKLIHLTFLISLFLIFLLPPTDPDLGWHLRCGQEIWQGQGFCGQNHFTVLLENYSWPNHTWGYQAIIYPIYQAFGGWGLTIFNALLMTAAFGFLFAAIRNHNLEKMLGILATIYFSWGVFSFGIRSQLMGFFFFNLTLYLLTVILTPSGAEGEGSLANVRPSNELRDSSPRYAPFRMTASTLLLPLTMLLWANIHGSVILGLILVGVTYLYAVACKRERILLHTVATATSGLVTLVNPFGFKIYEEMWRHFSGPIDLSKIIAEWVPPQPHIQQIILISGVAVFVYLLYRSLVETPRRGVSTLLLIPVFAFWALRARRNVPFYFVILSYSLLNSLKTKISPLRSQLAGLLSVGVLLYGLLVQLPQTIETNSSWENFCQKSSAGAPCAAIEFLKKQDVGNIFNRYEWGGFLIWQLPEYKIFVDGRMPAWVGPENKSPYTIYLETLQIRQADGQAQPGWQETLAQYDITYILISPNTFMDLLLEPDPENFGWQEVFRDKIAVVYKKSPE